jgi:glycine cleavage system H lipoate-binding protein
MTQELRSKMDKLGGKIPLLSILLVVLVQIGGGIVFLTNLSRDVQNNTDAIVHLIENDTAQYAIDEINNARTSIETNKILVDQLLLDVEYMKNVTDTLGGVDVSYLIERLTRLETEIQGIKEDSFSDDSWIVENKVDGLQTEIARLQAQFETVQRKTDDHVWTISDLQTKLIYLEQEVYSIPR